jgi:hypothetical protein
VISLVAAPAVGPLAAKVIEKVGDSLAQDATGMIDAAVEGGEGGGNERAADSDGDRSGDDEDCEAPASPPAALAPRSWQSMTWQPLRAWSPKSLA